MNSPLAPPAHGAKNPRWARAMVTGASSGIGEAVVRQLAAEGTDLVLVARRGDRLEAVAAELISDHGVRVETMVADLSAPVASAAVERRLASTSSPVDLLVNNAGVGTSGRFVDLALAREQQEIELNVVALTRLTSVALKAMELRGSGNVLNVASVAALAPSPGAATYAATKAYVVSFSEAVQAELADSPLNVTVSLPGFTRTEFHQRSGSDPSGVPERLWLSAESVARASLDAAHRGDARVVPGGSYKAYAAISSVVPSGLLARVIRRTRRRTHR